MVFTIEPMVNAGTWRDNMWPDGCGVTIVLCVLACPAWHHCGATRARRWRVGPLMPPHRRAPAPTPCPPPPPPARWTAVTADGKRSAQFEHQIVITSTGADILTQRLPTSPPLWWEAAGA